MRELRCQQPDKPQTDDKNALPERGLCQAYAVETDAGDGTEGRLVERQMFWYSRHKILAHSDQLRVRAAGVSHRVPNSHVADL